MIEVVNYTKIWEMTRRKPQCCKVQNSNMETNLVVSEKQDIERSDLVRVEMKEGCKIM
jgi:hypothetical protein